MIPCYNEASTIEALLTAILAVDYPDKEIIVVDDASTDGSFEQLEAFKAFPITLCRHPHNQGKGACLRTGIAQATKSYVLIQDADLEYDPQDYMRLLAPLLSGRADVVYGSRFVGDNPHRVMYFWHRLANLFLTNLSNAFTNLNLTDMEVCYKVFRREIIQSITIQENRFGVEPEITAKLAKKKCRFYEVGIAYHGRTYEEGKKIGWKDGLRAVYCIVRYGV